MKKITKASISALLSAVLLSLTLVSSQAAQANIDYVAFGDSVASGVRGGVGDPGSELGSDYGYTDNIANILKDIGILGSFNEELCISGNTAKRLAGDTEVLNDASSAMAKVVADAEIATVDIGANDLLGPLYDYVNTLKSVNDVDPIAAASILSTMVNNLYNGTVGPEVQANIETVLQNILNANKDVRIYVMGYYNPLPVLTASYNVDLNPSVKYFNTFITAAIDSVLAKNPGAAITYVPTFDAMAMSDKNLVPIDIHPTETGYKVIADEFWSKIRVDLAAYVPAAQQSQTKVLIDGKLVTFNAYVVNQNNFFKLRDLAMAISGSDKQFDVSWDGTKSAITMTTGKAYTPAGGELDLNSPDDSGTIAFSTASVYLDGSKILLTAYTIGGNNYFRLRDVAKILDFGVGYDNETSTVKLDTTVGYSE